MQKLIYCPNSIVSDGDVLRQLVIFSSIIASNEFSRNDHDWWLLTTREMALYWSPPSFRYNACLTAPLIMNRCFYIVEGCRQMTSEKNYREHVKSVCASPIPSLSSTTFKPAFSIKPIISFAVYILLFPFAITAK